MSARKRACVYEIVFDVLKSRNLVLEDEDAKAFLLRAVKHCCTGYAKDTSELCFMPIDVSGPGATRLKARLVADLESKNFTTPTKAVGLQYILDGLRTSKSPPSFMFFNPVVGTQQTFDARNQLISAEAQILYNATGKTGGSNDSRKNLIHRAVRVAATSFRLESDPTNKRTQKKKENEASSSSSDHSDHDQELADNPNDPVVPAKFSSDERVQRLKQLFRELEQEEQPVALMAMCKTMAPEPQAQFCVKLCQHLGRAPPAAKPDQALPAPGVTVPSATGQGGPVQASITTSQGPAPSATSQGGPAQAPGATGPALSQAVRLANPVLTPARTPEELENLRKLYFSLPSMVRERKADLEGHAWRLLSVIARLPGWLPVHATSLKDERTLYTTAVPPAVSKLLADVRLSCNVYYMLVALGGGNTVLAYLVLHLFHRMQTKTLVGTGEPRARVVDRSAAIERTHRAVVDILPLLRVPAFREQMGLGFLPLRPWEEGFQCWLRRYAPRLDGLPVMMQGAWDYLTDTVHMSVMETRFVMSWVMAVVHTNFGTVRILPAKHFLTRLLTKARFEPEADTYYLVSYTADEPCSIKQGCPMLDLPEYSRYRPDLPFKRLPTRQGLVIVPDLRGAYDRVVSSLGSREAVSPPAPAAPDDNPLVLVTYSCLVGGAAHTFDLLATRSAVVAHLQDPAMYTPEGFARAQAELRKRAELRQTARAPAPVAVRAPAPVQPARPKRARDKDEAGSAKKASRQPDAKPQGGPRRKDQPDQMPKPTAAELHRAAWAGGGVMPGEKRTRRAPK